MDHKLAEMLYLEQEPVGVFFGNTEVVCDKDASPETRNCVVPFLLAAAKGKSVSMDEQSCNCPGGATGCCFGDGFTRGNPNIHKMLSQGMGDDAPPSAPEHMRDGERFFCSEDIALTWRNQMPYSQRAYPRIVFAPESRWSEIGIPDLVLVFANADQLSVLVTMLGFHNGKALNTIAPYGAACHSIVFAAAQIEAEEPYGVLGLFDISQRKRVSADCLTLTVPYRVWEKMNEGLEKSCLTTKAWKSIEERVRANASARRG